MYTENHKSLCARIHLSGNIISLVFLMFVIVFINILTANMYVYTHTYIYHILIKTMSTELASWFESWFHHWVMVILSYASDSSGRENIAPA